LKLIVKQSTDYTASFNPSLFTHEPIEQQQHRKQSKKTKSISQIKCKRTKNVVQCRCHIHGSDVENHFYISTSFSLSFQVCSAGCRRGCKWKGNEFRWDEWWSIEVSQAR